MSDKKSLRFQPFFFFASIVILMGCTSVIGFPTYSGFLGDYKGMYRSNIVKGAFIIDNPQKRVTDYDKFTVAPVVVYLIPQAKAYNLSPQLLGERAKDFQEAMKTELAKHYTVVDSPGPGVLVLKFALTDLEYAEVKDKTRVLLEADFLDGETGQRVVALAYGFKTKTIKEWATLLATRLIELGLRTKVYTFDNQGK